MIFGIQILVFLFGLFMIYYSYIHYKRKEFSKNVFVIWETLWIFMSFIVLFPNIFSPITSILNLSSNFNLFVVFGLIFLFSLSYYLFISTKKLEKKIEKLVISIAKNKDDTKWFLQKNLISLYILKYGYQEQCLG